MCDYATVAGTALIAQWIELLRPKERILVRFRVRAHSCKQINTLHMKGVYLFSKQSALLAATV